MLLLGVNSWLWHGEIERDNKTFCSAMMVEWWMRMKVMRKEDENDVEHTSEYTTPGLRLGWLDWEDLVSVILHARLGHVRAVSGMVSWLTQEILLSPTFEWWFAPSPPISLLLILNCTIIYEHEVESSLSISPYHDQELTQSAACTQYSIHRVQRALSTAYTEYCKPRDLYTLTTAFTA